MSNDDIKERYAGRLGDDGIDTNAESEQNDSNEMSSKSEGGDKNEMNVWNVSNVKNEWKGWTVYLPESYLEDVKDESKLLDVRLDRDVKMDRHFKPLLIALGMEQLEGMEDNEVREFIERMEEGELND